MFWPDPMALLDDLFSGVVNAVAGDKAPALNQFVQSSGGLSGLAATFQRGGAGEVFSSWVSTNDNQVITADQIKAVMGTSQIQELASKLGVDPNQAADFIAQHLPQVVDKLTPSGQLSS
jgi:uncharacterized protein YidB (DUF937 family)